MDGGGAAGRNSETVIGRMSGQLDEYVDLVGSHYFRYFFILKAVGVTPAVGQVADGIGIAILFESVRITVNGKPLSGQMTDQGQEEIAHRMMLEIS